MYTMRMLGMPSFLSILMHSHLLTVFTYRPIEQVVYHPGYSSTHVTRLHRYDHSGMDAFLEREAAWHASLHFDEIDSRGDLRGTRSLHHAHQETLSAEDEQTREHRSSRTFARLSLAQVGSWIAHHKDWLQNSTSKSNGTTVLAHEHGHEQLAGPTPDETVSSGSNSTKRLGTTSARAVTALSALSSQYVGPIGVGTTLQPESCNSPQSMSLLDIDALRRANSTSSATTCKADVQSYVWVVHDTGSTNIWIASDLCTEGPCVQKGRQRYNHKRSVTFKNPEAKSELTVQFGTGKLRGPRSIDDFHIGPFSVFQQSFEMIERQEGSVFEQVPLEGILGLAFPKMSAHGATPFFDTIINQKTLERNEFAFYFSRDQPAANAIFWGGVDKGFYTGDIEFFPVTDPYYWAMDLHAFKIGAECLLGPACGQTDANTANSMATSPAPALPATQSSMLQMQGAEAQRSSAKFTVPKAIVDSGTTYFTAQQPLFDIVMKKLPSSQCLSITEKSHPNITITLKNVVGVPRDFIFTHKMYMLEAGVSQCQPAFMHIEVPAEHGPGMVLGEVFMRYYYSVFDRGDGSDLDARIGFAPSVHSKAAMRRLKELTYSQPSFELARGSKRPGS